MNYSIKIKTADERIITLPENGEADGVRVDIHEKKIDGGHAVYFSLRSDIPLSADEALTVIPIDQETEYEFLAIENHSPYWCRPAFGKDFSTLHQRTQALLLKLENKYKYILPVCADTAKTLVRADGTMRAFVTYTNCESVSSFEKQLAYIELEGNDPETLYRDGARLAAKLLDNGLRMREERIYPEHLEYLGWCSWDAFQIRVSHEGLLEKAKEFSDKNVPVHFAIIDDMWADVPNLNEIPKDISFGDMCRAMHKSPMRSFEGDPKRFPNGMAAAISDLKAAGIPAVAIWLPTTGYWKGFMRDGEFAKENADILEELAEGSYSVSPDAKKAYIYFQKLTEKCRSWGADFLKIDNQGCHTKFKNIAPIGKSGRAMQNAIDSAAALNADGLINCMGMPSECMFNRKYSAISRCSDDFMPESREWFSKNILQCAYNGILQGQFYANDWDMFWTDDEQAKKNSVCRAISGGPVYVSDKLGRTRPEILAPIHLSDGRLLRCDMSAVPTADCLFGNPIEGIRPLKIYNRVGKAALIAAFNINKENRPVNGTVSPADACLPDGAYAVYEYFTKEGTVKNFV